ncbi:MBL fold metallo-hydrolase [Planktomarina temperata]|nr:MBL fold metallo-hydrolase [Planktomarina temperata]MDB2459777.1 MBL fold metallo-hydrolase [Planktomarina temperata]
MRTDIYNYYISDEQFEFVMSPMLINSSNLENGITQLEHFVVLKEDNRLVIYDRLCDHNAGQLITKGDEIVCPMHGWRLDPRTGQYLNVQQTKKPVYDGLIPNDGTVNLQICKPNRILPKFEKNLDVNIRFLNHACLIIESGTTKFAIDPWLLGSAFCTGWWLEYPSPNDAISELNKCDFIYISHNHPDHLHPETLSHVRKDITILTPKFHSGSTVNFLEKLGFNNLYPVELGKTLVDFKSETAFTVVKSGDFRDDSGLYFQFGKFTGLLSVDCKFIDQYRFNQEINFLASSFASGASGFPLCFDNYTQSEKLRLLNKNRAFAKASTIKMIDHCRPNYFMPYAGFFREASYRDVQINTLNKKNSIADYLGDCDKREVELLDVLQNDFYKFEGQLCTLKRKNGRNLIEEHDTVAEITRLKESCSMVDREHWEQYFLDSEFYDNLDLELQLTDDNFNVVDTFWVQFFEDKPCEVSVKKILRRKSSRLLSIKVRREVMVSVISNGLPWEDMVIGFQCRIYRQPNIYNSKFWYHFTNIYVAERANMSGRNCGTCEAIIQSL